MPEILPSMLIVLGGLVSASMVEAQSRVLFDQGHGQRFLVDSTGELDLSELGAVFRSSGLEVNASTEPLTPERLARHHALVMSGPFRPLEPGEITAILDFVEKGGALATMLHIPGPLAVLLHRLGVVHSNGVVRERDDVIDDEPLNFSVSRLGDHPLTEGLASFRIYGSWALLGQGEAVKVVAETGSHSWVDLDGNSRLGPHDALQAFAVVLAGRLGSGRFVVFGDDAMFQNRFLEGSNLDLAANLARWLAEPAAGLVAIQMPDGRDRVLE